ncbi:universal stress protein [Natrarchaeobaculum sulfurireducens]|uniref:Nucleotide-binding protein, UspA family n=1 Tax=Natrarchaeobaculum sulfurireducens TaxID=2044521 RepID=A0A346PIP0_9EURY|nr:universal stress protein [Natrarchaeobaculum sulfurireducens]AXR79385.1 Nucleotide-binding protein, UspA family [Natrarchaeobaculum sulfurireducens]
MAGPRDHRVLLPIDVLGGEAVPETVVEAFASVPIVLLGYRELPDQVGTDQARDQYGERAHTDLETLHDVFEAAGCLDVTTRLVFTHDRLKTFERVAVEERCDAVLVLNPAPVLESVLVALRGDVALEYIATLVGTLLEGTDLDVTFFHVVDESNREHGRTLLETAVDELAVTGVDRDRIDTALVADGSPTRRILEAAADHDLLVVGESRPSIRRFILRDRAKTLAKGTVDPVLVIRGEYLEQDGTAAEGGHDAVEEEP